MTALAFLIVALAAYRATRLVTSDSISRAFRDRLYDWAWDDSKPVVNPKTKQAEPSSRGVLRSYVFTLLTCALCFGVWASAAVYVLWRWVDWMPMRAALVILAIAGAQCALQYFTEAAESD